MQFPELKFRLREWRRRAASAVLDVEETMNILRDKLGVENGKEKVNYIFEENSKIGRLFGKENRE